MNTNSKPLVYLAGPFFSAKQKITIENMEHIIKLSGFNVYSPMKECLFEKGVTVPSKIFEDNVNEIDSADLIVVITDGKDVGTLFEAGFAYGIGTKIVYIWLDSNGMKFNIMLKESASAICLSYEHLEYTLKQYIETGGFVSHPGALSLELE